MIVGEIYLHLNEGTGEISRENIFPETPEETLAIQHIKKVVGIQVGEI